MKTCFATNVRSWMKFSGPAVLPFGLTEIEKLEDIVQLTRQLYFGCFSRSGCATSESLVNSCFVMHASSWHWAVNSCRLSTRRLRPKVRLLSHTDEGKLSGFCFDASSV